MKNDRFSAIIPAITASGDITLIFVNPSGGEFQFQNFYMTDDCPIPGQYGVGSNCQPCPVGAIWYSFFLSFFLSTPFLLYFSLINYFLT